MLTRVVDHDIQPTVLFFGNSQSLLPNCHACYISMDEGKVGTCGCFCASFDIVQIDEDDFAPLLMKTVDYRSAEAISATCVRDVNADSGPRSRLANLSQERLAIRKAP